MRRLSKLIALVAFSLLWTLGAAAKEKDKQPAGDLVDSGSFGIFLNDKRVATETFSVHQSKGGDSTAVSQFKEEGSNNPSQRSEMQMSTSGALIRYEWHELSPGKSEIVLVPNNEFLVERVVENPGDKAKEKPFLMPNTSVILDNNFFIHREILVWKYMASSCPLENGRMKCGPATIRSHHSPGKRLGPDQHNSGLARKSHPERYPAGVSASELEGRRSTLGPLA